MLSPTVLHARASRPCPARQTAATRLQGSLGVAHQNLNEQLKRQDGVRGARCEVRETVPNVCTRGVVVGPRESESEKEGTGNGGRSR